MPYLDACHVATVLMVDPRIYVSLVLLECKANRIDPYPQVVSLFFQLCYYCLRLRHVAASRNACQATPARVLRLYGANGRRLKTAYDTVGQD